MPRFVGKTPPRKIDPKEKKHRLARVEVLMLTGAPLSLIVQAIAEERRKDDKLPLSRALVETLAKEVRESWRARAEQERADAKVEQGERLRAHIAKASSRNSHGAVAQLERLYADLHGTLAPTRIEVDATLVQREALFALVGGMNEEEFDRVAESQAQLEADAAQARVLRGLGSNGSRNGAPSSGA